jgi:hypothetical protein
VDGAVSRPRKAGIVTGRSSLMEDLFDQINGCGRLATRVFTPGLGA